MRLLLVEDQPKVAGFIRRGLEEEHYAVDIAAKGNDALDLVAVNTYDLIILDLMLPDISGFDVCQELRRDGVTVPVLMLTALDALDDKVAGLDSGADDYLTKPFAFPEFLARVRALLRRGVRARSQVLTVADLEVDTVRREVRRAGQPIRLTAKEYAVLEYLTHNAGRVL